MARKNAGIESPDLKVAHQKAGVYWQAGELNRRAYIRYFDQFLQLAINRCKWHNLPKGCNARYLEWTLARSNCAVIFQMPGVEDRYYSTKVMQSGPLNVYDDPTKFRSTGNNGWDVKLDRTQGVIVWNSMSRTSIWNTLEYYAKRIADVDRTIDINLKNQKTPWLITGPEEKQNEITNMYKSVDGNEAAIIGLPSLTDTEIKAINTEVEFKGVQLQQLKKDLINEVLEYLGIDAANTQKRERLIEAEVEAGNGMTEMMRLDALDARRMACEELNEKFGLDIFVTWNKDIATDNYRALHDLKDASDLNLVGGDNNESVQNTES